MANKRVQFRRGTTADHSSFTGASGEITVDTTNNSIRVHDNSTAGGIESARADMSNIAPSSAVDFNAQKLSNIGTPTATSDAATKAYVDASFAGGNFNQLTDVSLGTLSGADLAIYDGSSSWVNRAISGDATLSSTGELTIANDAIDAGKLADDAVDTAAIQDSSVTNAKLANSEISVTDGVTASSISLGGQITFSGTANEVTVAQSGGEVTLGLPDDVNVAGNLSIGGNLVVSGTLTTVNTQTIELQDNIITLNSGTTGSATENAGIEIDRGDDANVQLRFNETSDEWEVTTDGTNFHEIAHSGNSSSVTTSMITDANVTTVKIADANVTTAKIADGNVTAAKMAADSVATASIQDDAVTDAKLADNAVLTATIADLNVTTAKLDDDAVTPAKASFVNDSLASTSGHLLLGDGSVFSNVALAGDASIVASGTITISNSAVTTAKLDDGSVVTAKLGADAVTNAKLADDAVQTENIVDLHVTTAKINDDAVTPAKASFVNDSLASTSGHLMVGDGSVFSNVAAAGDLTLTSAGTFSIVNGAVDTAALGADAVTNAKLADDAVQTENIVDLHVTTAKINDDAVTTAKINAGAVTTTELGADAVTNAKLADNAVQTENIADANVTTAKIADSNVTTAKIADSNVTTAKIADSNITTAKIADDAVTPAKVSVLSDTLLSTTAQRFLFTQDTVTGYQATALSGDISVATDGTVSLTANSVITSDITDANVTTAKLASESVDTSKLAYASVTEAKIALNAITTGKIADDAVTQAKIGPGAVGTTELAADAVTSSKITDANVTTAKIADSNVTTAKIADLNVTTGKLADDAVTTAKIAANAVTSTELASSVAGNGLGGGGGASLFVAVDDSTIILNGNNDLAVKDSGVTTSKIADSAITEGKINNSAVTTSKINAGAVTTTLLADSAVTTAKIADLNVTNAKLASSTITISANSGTPDAVALGETLAIIGTTNEVETAVSNNQLQIGLPSNVTVSNNLTAVNDLTVGGDSTLVGDLDVTGDTVLVGYRSYAALSKVQLGGAAITTQVLGTATLDSTLEVDGAATFNAGVSHATAAFTSGNITLTSAHHIVTFGGSFDTAGADSITIPAASSHSGREYVIIEDATSSSLDLTFAGSDYNDGVANNNSSVSTSGTVTVLYSNGSHWFKK